MKLRNLFAGMILCLAVASCIQDEAQNVEAAIDGCSGNHIQQYLIDRNDFTVQLYVSKAADPSKINIRPPYWSFYKTGTTVNRRRN